MDAQRLTRTEYDGTITVLADRFEGKRLTAPNDVVVKADGSIWFSDNGAGTRGNYLGHKAPWELPFRVYRLDPETRTLTMVVDDMQQPNGLAFSPDETLLYVVDTPGPGQRTVQVYDMVDQGTKVAIRREFCSAEPGGSDGLRVDTDDNVWCAWSGGEAEDGVAIYAPNGTMIGRILLPERCANLCFGGQKRNRLFMAASQSIYAPMSRPRGSWVADAIPCLAWVGRQAAGPSALGWGDGQPAWAQGGLLPTQKRGTETNATLQGGASSDGHAAPARCAAARGAGLCARGPGATMLAPPVWPARAT